MQAESRFIIWEKSVNAIVSRSSVEVLEMNNEQFHQVLIRFEPSFRACFPALTDEDFQQLLAGPRENLLLVLHRRYGYSNAQARSAWNEFILRYVDGQT